MKNIWRDVDMEDFGFLYMRYTSRHSSSRDTYAAGRKVADTAGSMQRGRCRGVDTAGSIQRGARETTD